MNMRITQGLALCALVATGVLSGCMGGGGRRTVAYVMTNAAAGNSVMAFRINANGGLTQIGGFATGGNGTGITETPLAGPVDGIDPLGSQGSLVMSPDRRFLFAVNAGSNSISSFQINPDGTLVLVEAEASGGTSPVSLAVSNSRVYVANVNNPGGLTPSNLVGFNYDVNGNMTLIAGSTTPLSSPGARPSQVSFIPDGTKLIVTERETNAISTFAINVDGTLQAAVTTPSAGPAPFGFDFARGVQMVVSDAAPGDLAGPSASSYLINANGTVTVVSGRVLNGQLASCWVNVTPDGSTAIVSNTGSNTLSTYRVNPNGSLTLLQAAIGTNGAGSAPIDADLDRDGNTFVQLLGGTGAIAVYSVSGSGTVTLRQVQTVGLPALGTQGLVVR